jgi:hypothetical protein
MQCPFVYAKNHQCTGMVRQARAYGKAWNGVVDVADVKKIRFWCSDKDDHAGAVSSFEAKNRMEFYPDELAKRGLYDEAIRLCENVTVSA